MPSPDAGHLLTEQLLGQTEEEIATAYGEAQAGIIEELINFLFTVDDINDIKDIYVFLRTQNKLKKQALQEGKITQKEYNKWKAEALAKEKGWVNLQKTLADDLTHSREIATSIINNKKCDVYALNYNYATYEIEKGIGASTSFALYDHDTVERLIVKKPDLLPTYTVNREKDFEWNKKHINHAVTQGILQGKSNQDIAEDMKKVCNMGKNSAIKTARTATTCAQNAGRIDGYKRAQGMGISLKQIWISTLDGRTRHEHRKLMGQKREIGKPFEVDGYEIMFPGDPTAKAFLVYNCRCTLIADVDGANYDLENRIEQHLKEKDLTWDEWINEQPLPRHYDESKKDYLKRYKEHHKKMKFSDWMEDQVMPDSLITKNWADKKMSNIYNMIKEQNVTDANKFYKELGKLGKPSEVWDKYLTGQLDAEDLKSFEEILKKYLPKETTTEAVKKTAKETATETVIDFDAFKEKLPAEIPYGSELYKELESLDLDWKYSMWKGGKADSELDNFFKDYQKKAAKKVEDLEKQIKYTKSDPMSFDDADMHHVNPNYNGNHGIYSVNCQTCAMTYEARRQGYDVIALGKDKTHPHTFALQTEVGKDQARAWINKTTGLSPAHLECSPKLQTAGKYKFLEDTVGHNGERYTISVAWKGGGAHVINMDRDANGVLRLIDNQRGKNEKHIWTGEKEIKQYLDKTQKIKYVLRVDDCIPNPKYFNMITKESNTVKSVAKKNEKTIDVLGKKYTKIDLSNMTDDDLWETLSIAGYSEEFLEKFDGPNFKKNILDEIFSNKPAVNILDKSLFKDKKMSAVYTDIKKTDVKTANAFYKELQKMGKPSDVWDKYLKGELPDVDVQKIEKHLQKKYSDLEEAMPGESVTGLDIDTLSTKKVTGVYNDFVAAGDKTTANKFYNELKKIATTKGYKSQSDVWKKYLNGELDFDDIEKIDKYVIKKYQTTTAPAPGIEPAKSVTKADLPGGWKELYNSLDQDNIDKLVSAFMKNANDTDSLGEYYLKWKNGKVNDQVYDEILLGIKPGSAIKIDYDKLPGGPANVYSKLKGKIDSDSANEFKDLLDNIANAHDPLDSYDIWEKYKKQQLNENEMKQIDGIVSKLDEYTVKDKASIKTKADLPEGIENLDTITKKEVTEYLLKTNPTANWVDYWHKYKTNDINDPELDKILGIKSETKSKVDLLDNYVDTIHHLSDSDKVKLSDAWIASGGHISPQQYYTKWKNGEIQDPVFDEILLGKKSTTKPTSSTIDYNNLPPVTKVYSDLNDISSDLSFKFYNALNDAQKLNESMPDVWEKYKKKQLTKEQTEEIDKLVEQWQKYTSASTTAKPVDIKSKADLPDTYKEFLTQYDYSVVQKFDDYVAKLGEDPVTFYKKYKNGTLNIGGAGVNKILGIPITKADLPIDLDYIEDAFDGSTWQKVYDHCSGETTYAQYKYFEKYVNGEIDDPELDKILGVTAPKTAPKPAPAAASASAPSGQKVVDLDQLKNKKVTEIYNEIKNDVTNKYSGGAFYNELKKIGKDTGIGKQGDVWAKYVAGELDPAEAAKIDKYVIKKYSKIEEPPKFDKSAYQGKKMSNVYNELKAENTTNANQFYNYLKSIGKPSKVWQDYLDDKLIKEQADEIEKYLEKLSPKQKAQTVSPTGSKLTPEQQKELDDAKKELEKAKAALPDDKKFSGIWKNEVGVSEYTAKKKTIAAKRVYFEDELEKAKKRKNQNPHEPGTPQYEGYIKWNEDQIAKFEKLLKSLDEFEQLGKEYEKAYKVVEKAQKKVDSLTPEAEAYSQERKDKAKWYTYSQYRSGDAYYTKWAKPIHASSTSAEHSAYYAYTSASGAFNRPLAGFKSPKYSGGSGWSQTYFKGVGKVPLDNEGKGNAIKNLTTFIEKSKTKDDIWMQTAQNFATLEGKGGFLDIPYGTLQGMTDTELQQFIGIENQLGQFVSGSISRGGGTYTPGSMRINIYCPKGSEALYVLSDGAFGKAEREIILQRGGTYKITKMYWGQDVEKGGRRLIVDMELRLEKGYNKYGQ